MSSWTPVRSSQLRIVQKLLARTMRQRTLQTIFGPRFLNIRDQKRVIGLISVGLDMSTFCRALVGGDGFEPPTLSV